MRKGINLFLKATRQDIESQYDLNGESDGPTDQDDELYFIDSLNDIVQLAVHHDAGHFEAEIEESNQKGNNNDNVQSNVHTINHRKTQLVHIVHY